MAELTLDGVWIAQFTDPVLRSRFGSGALDRGLGYARERRVGQLETGDHGRMLLAQVTGGEAVPYEVLVLADPAHPAAVRSRCSCPMRLDCKHVVAVIVTARSLVAGLSAPAYTWHDVLDGALEAAHESDRRSLQAVPLALQFSFAAPRAKTRWGADPPSNLPRLRIRPMAMGSAGRWVKQGAGWDDLMRTSMTRPLDPDHRDVLGRIHGLRLTNRYAYFETPEHLDVADLGAHIWPLLAEARGAGVEFVPLRKDDPPVLLAQQPATFGVEVSRGQENGLEVRAQIAIEGDLVQSADVVLLGSPAHGVLYRPDPTDSLLVAGLDRPLRPAEHALAHGPDRLQVPAADVPRFTASYYPALRRSMDIAARNDVGLPVVQAPKLALEASFGPGLEVLLKWSFRYVVGDDARHVDVVPPAESDGSRPISLARDVPAEEALIASLPAPDRPNNLTVMVGRRRALVPVQRFRELDAIAVATELLPALARRDDVHVTMVGEVPDFREAAAEPIVKVRAHEVDPADAHDRTDWFDLSVSVSIDGEGVPFVNLFTALAKRQPYLVLDSGTYFSLDNPELEQLRALIEESRHLLDPESATLRVSPEHAGLWDELVAIGVVAEQSQAWMRAVGALLNQHELPAIEPPADLRADLRPYQLDGFRWLSFLIDARLGGVLADDMGLGKTLQTLAMASRAAEQGRLDGTPLLVVAPTSVVSTWASEAAKFTPSLRVRSLTETSRRRRTSLIEAVGDAQVVVTSYAILRLDAAQFAAAEWGGLVLDEAQFVKNHRSKTYQAVRKIRAPSRFALSGTPLENSLMDLWSLLSIAAPGLFPDPEAFADIYRRPIEDGTDPAKLPRLLRQIRPLVLRRTKEAVATELPPKQEQVVNVTLSPAHRRRYDTHLHRERQKVLKLLADEDLGRHRVAIFRSLTLLRLLSLAPSLVDSEDATPATKLEVLMELLADVVAGGHRALVFSQFTGFLALVRERLGSEGIGHVYLDGRTRNRQRRIDEFKDGDDPVFCISLKAGGFGLTLTEADYVFVLDPWWNPAAENQAIDRTHRIGQDKHVMVYRLVAADTIEEKVVALQQRKRDLFAAVVGEATDVAAPLSAEDIRGLLEG